MYKILSLDGGGMHGYAAVIIIRRLLEKYPSLLEDVDLIAGTSIGGILGLGFALGHPIDVIEENFVKGIPLAFSTNMVRMSGFIAGVCPKYDNSKFKRFLAHLYQHKKLKDLKTKVLIPAFCLDNEKETGRRWKAKFFHNFEGVDSDGEAEIVDVAMATSAVPVFFPSYDKYIDGAMIANNPAFAAITQTQDFRNDCPCPSLMDISVLSLGTIRDVFITGRNLDWGYFMWARSLLQMLTERDTLMVNHMCNMFIGERYHRIEPVINGPMDNFEELKEIKKIADNYPIEKTVSWLKEFWS